jgi:hypothetical protein
LKDYAREKELLQQFITIDGLLQSLYGCVGSVLDRFVRLYYDRMRGGSAMGNALNNVKKMYPIDAAKLLEVKEQFTYHAPAEDQLPRYNALREEGFHLALVIMRLTPPGADQSAALRKLRECMMTANAAIALEKRE